MMTLKLQPSHRKSLIIFGIVLFNGCAALNSTDEVINFADRPYKGNLIGKFQQLKKGETPNLAPNFRVSGTLYAVDEQLLYIHEFIYDGAFPGMLLWAISKDPRTLKEDQHIIPTVNECTAAPTCTPLPAIWEENCLFALPRTVTFESISEIAVGTRDSSVLYPQLKERYATVAIPPGFQYPRPVILPTRLGNSVIAGGVSSQQIIIQDSRRIFIQQVTFDGSASDAYFWVDRNPVPTPSGFMVAPNNDETPPRPLQRLPKEPLTTYDALLDLRRAFRPGKSGNVQLLTVFDLKNVAIYDRKYETVFGDAPFNGSTIKGKVPAALDDLNVQRISEKAVSLIRDLNYQIGVDNGIQVGPLPTFPRTPPPHSRIQLAATSSGEMLGDDPNGGLPLISTANPVHSWNCEILDDVLEVQWRVQTSFITITLSAHLTPLFHPENSYLAFGISGARKKSQMIGSDVTLGFVSESRLHLGDFVLGAKTPLYALRTNITYGSKGAMDPYCDAGGCEILTTIPLQCNLENPKIDAVCPRKLVGGKQVSRLVAGGGLKDGKLSFSYRRPLETTDILGKDVPLDTPVHVIWSIGSINPTTKLPEHHKIHSKESTMIHFGRLPQNNCFRATPGAFPDAPKNSTIPSL